MGACLSVPDGAEAAPAAKEHPQPGAAAAVVARAGSASAGAARSAAPGGAATPPPSPQQRQPPPVPTPAAAPRARPSLQGAGTKRERAAPVRRASWDPALMQRAASASSLAAAAAAAPEPCAPAASCARPGGGGRSCCATLFSSLGADASALAVGQAAALARALFQVTTAAVLQPAPGGGAAQVVAFSSSTWGEGDLKSLAPQLLAAAAAAAAADGDASSGSGSDADADAGAGAGAQQPPAAPLAAHPVVACSAALQTACGCADARFAAAAPLVSHGRVLGAM